MKFVIFWIGIESDNPFLSQFLDKMSNFSEMAKTNKGLKNYWTGYMHKNEQLLANKRIFTRSLILVIANPFLVNARRISKQQVFVKAKSYVLAFM